MELVRLYHEMDRQVMFLKQLSNIGFLVNVNEIATILHYAECFAKSLMQYSQHCEYCIAVQEYMKDVYYMLQFHNFASWIANHGCALESTGDVMFQNRLQKLWNQSLTAEGAGAESLALQGIWKQSLLWAERGCAKTQQVIHIHHRAAF